MTPHSTWSVMCLFRRVMILDPELVSAPVLDPLRTLCERGIGKSEIGVARGGIQGRLRRRADVDRLTSELGSS